MTDTSIANNIREPENEHQPHPQRLFITDFIPFNRMVAYSNHPFTLYEGQRLDDMTESIRANGIFSPPIVRRHPTQEGMFEMLSGHNRRLAGIKAGFEGTTCYIVPNLSDEEAHLFVVESNLLQRSFTDMTHSEKAAALAVQYQAMKTQGKRNDLVDELKNLINNGDKADDSGENTTSSQIGAKSRTADSVGEKYGLGKSDVARYIRVSTILDGFKSLLDKSELSLGAAYNISFLSLDHQEFLYYYITITNETKIGIKHAVAIRLLSEKGRFTEQGLNKIFEGKNTNQNQGNSHKPKPTISIKYKRKGLVERGFIKPNASDKEISDTIMKALEFYHHYGDKIRVVVEDEVSVPPPKPSIDELPSILSQTPTTSNSDDSTNKDEAEQKFDDGLKAFYK